MTRGRVAFVVVLAALVAAVLPAGSGAADECNGIQRCIPVQGPWVAVPVTGEVEFMLECPQGRGIVAGTDALATSQDVHATFDAIIGSPIAYGRSTNFAALFRALSAHHRPGAFQPYLGCIPAPTSVRNTLAAKATPIGPPLDLKARLVKLRPGGIVTVSLSCDSGEVLADSWSAKAFATTTPPPPELAQAIQLATSIRGRQASLSITTSEVLPSTANAEVQLGVRCARQ